MLVKAGRSEDVLVRRALFITASITVVRPAAALDAASDRYRWRYEAFLQRQVCFTSMTGLFACTLAQVEGLPDKATGEAALPAAPAAQVFPEGEAVKRRLMEGLRVRAGALFEAGAPTWIPFSGPPERRSLDLARVGRLGQQPK